MILRDKVYQAIKERIIRGEYAPGQPLTEKEIIEELKVSRTPFREAVNALCEEGLIQIYPHRGVFVRELSLKDVIDGFDIRYLLEPYAVELACYSIPLSKIDELIYRIETLDKADYQAMLEEDNFFHLSLIEYIENKQLRKIMKNLYSYNQFQTALFDNIKSNNVDPDRLNGAIKSLSEHLDILISMKKKDTAESAEKMRYHLSQARKRLLK